MWFDAHAKLAEIATQAPAARPVSQVSQVSQPPEAQKPAFRVASVATVATPLTATVRAAALPDSPPTCAACGVADWKVAVTEKEGRTLHVSCCRAEGGSPRRLAPFKNR
jgi:hypothetical protein